MRIWWNYPSSGPERECGGIPEDSSGVSDTITLYVVGTPTTGYVETAEVEDDVNGRLTDSEVAALSGRCRWTASRSGDEEEEEEEEE